MAHIKDLAIIISTILLVVLGVIIMGKAFNDTFLEKEKVPQIYLPSL